MPCKKCALNFKKRHFEKKTPQKLAIFKSLPEPFSSVYFSETCLMVLSYSSKKFARVWWNIFGNILIQLVPMSRKEKLTNLFLEVPDRLKTWPKALHSYSFIKLSRNEAFKHFLVNFIKRLPCKQWPLWQFWLQFSLYILKTCMTVQSFITVKWKENNYQ